MTIKERVLEKIDRLDEVGLERIERHIDEEMQEKIARQLAALRAVTGILSEPDDIAAFEEATRRRSLFDGRRLDLEPNDRA